MSQEQGILKMETPRLFSKNTLMECLWLDGSNGDFVGGDYFGIHAYGTTSLDFSYGASSKVSIGSNGNVGIGTASPLSKFDIYGSSSTYILLLVVLCFVTSVNRQIALIQIFS